MAKVLNLNRTDTPITGVTTLNLSRGLLNFTKDFRVKENEPKEAIISNLTSPLGKPECFRWGASEITDVYRNSAVEKSLQSPSKRGYQVLCQISDVWSVSDSTDPSYGYDLPIEAHVVLKIPADSSISESNILELVGRLVSGLFDTGDTSTSRIKALLRGSLIPSDLK